MTQAPPSDFFTRRVCLQLDGMDDVTVRRDVAYGPPEGRLRMDIYYPPDQTRRWLLASSDHRGRLPGNDGTEADHLDLQRDRVDRLDVPVDRPVRHGGNRLHEP